MMEHEPRKLRKTSDGRLAFWCPGCKEAHAVVPGRWTWNGDMERPTFRPSVLVTSGHYCPGWKPGEHCWCTYNAQHPEARASFSCMRCHTFVTDGQIQFLGDCTHEYAGRTIELIPF